MQHQGSRGVLEATKEKKETYLCFGSLRVIKLLKSVHIPRQLADAQARTSREQSRRFLILPN